MSGRMTLEQKRALNAWEKSDGAGSDYAKLAKGLPALIMNSGLLQVLAFLHEKGKKPPQEHCKKLGNDLREWLHSRFPEQLPDAQFHPFMEALMQADSAQYRQVTAEAFAWLRWMRQVANARNDGGDRSQD